MADLQKTFNIVWKNLKKLEATARHLKRIKKNQKKKKKKKKLKNLLIGFLDNVEWGIWESQKGLRHWISNFVFVLLTTVIQYFIWAKKKSFIVISLTSQTILSQFFSDFFKQY
jgi:hypothetical protein